MQLLVKTIFILSSFQIMNMMRYNEPNDNEHSNQTIIDYDIQMFNI